jgi:hypothetical protein
MCWKVYCYLEEIILDLSGYEENGDKAAGPNFELLQYVGTTRLVQV